MSYDLHLKCPTCRHTAQVEAPHHIKGGTYAVGGTTYLELHVTYNYSAHLRKALGEKGIRTIYGLTAADSIPVLEEAIAKLQGNPDNDYWAATEGNARAALVAVLELAHMAPAWAVWEGD